MDADVPVMCKYCNKELLDNIAEGLQCKECECSIHLKCLVRGSVPGSLMGDVFFNFVCQECSTTNKEHFQRSNMTWLQTVVLVMHHLHNKSPGIANRGFFHWKTHIAAFIDKHWAVLFPKDVKRKKKWIGTISGTLSHYNPLYFKSGTALFGVSGWWKLTYATLSPSVLMQINSELISEKPKNKFDKTDTSAKLRSILTKKGYDYEQLSGKVIEPLYLEPSVTKKGAKHAFSDTDILSILKDVKKSYPKVKKMKYGPEFNKAIQKVKTKEKSASLLPSDSNGIIGKSGNQKSENFQQLSATPPENIDKQCTTTEQTANPRTLMDPMCHYNTCLQNLEHVKGIDFRTRLMGGMRKEIMKSPFTERMLKPFIRRDMKSISSWTKLMIELQYQVNSDSPDWQVPKRAPIDYTYVQPEHIPAINSLCAIHFWPGIDLAETLEYPDFSCVVLYKKLIIGFAFLIPDVNLNEAYISFIFTKPNWRNIGIGRFMIYHLIQTCMTKDITLHVSINNPAIFLYQKFGFKVEKVILDFYETYMRNDSKECKHAFFLRLER